MNNSAPATEAKPKSDLGQRVLTGLILAPAVVALVFFGPTWALLGVAGLIWLIGAWEWGGMLRAAHDAPAPSTVIRGSYLLLIAALMYAAYLLGVGQAVLCAGALWWLLALVWVIRYPVGLPADNTRRRLKAVIGPLVLVPSWIAIGVIHAGERGAELTLFALFLVWAADVGAYFAGKRFGKRKLSPKVSPNKSWEGVYGALAADLLLGLIGAWYFGYEGVNFLLFVMLSVFIVPVSVVGDLTESMFKRHSRIKDSGTIFPGHGGVLDRVDALTSALPVFALGLALVG